MRKFLTCAVLILVTLSVLTKAQEAPKAEIFGGFSYLHLDTGDVSGLEANHYGWNAALGLNANRWFGIKADFSGHYKDLAPGVSFNSFTAVFGPQLTYRAEKASPFVHALFGVNRASIAGSSDSAFAMALGGGLDINLGRRLAFRLFQADYLMTRHSFSVDEQSPDERQDNFRLSTGLVLKLGGGEPAPPPTASCSVQPSAVMAGEPVSATISTQNFNPKHTIEYKWQASDGKVTESGTSASIDTTGLQPGNYTVSATATDPKAKKNNMASCQASFTINEPPRNPPTISCSSNPTTVRSGDPSTITCEVASPDNRSLTTTCTSTGGRISGSGTTFTLDTAGAPAGRITVNCTTTDDRGLDDSTSTSVMVEVPPPPPTVSKLNEIAFPNKAKPARVDNTAKAILDDVALRLQRDADAKAVIVGYYDPAERGKERLAQQRAVNTKAYLTKEKGIDPARLEVRTGTAGGTRAEIYLVPTGATFNQAGTMTFDESKVKPQTR